MMEMPKIAELTDVVVSIEVGTRILEVMLSITDNEEDKAILKKSILLYKQLGLQLTLANETIKQINNCTGKD